MKTIISSAFLFFMGFSLMAQSPVSLKLNLEKGKLYTIKSTSKHILQQTYNGQQFKIDINSNFVITYTVLKQEGDVMNMEIKFDTIARKMSSPMFNQETNSTKPGKDPLSKLMNKFSQYKLIAKISTNGKFVEFVNYHQFKDSVMIALDEIPAAKKDQAKTIADGLLKESVIRSMVEPFFTYLPENPVKIGDNWETSYFGNAFNINYLSVNTYTLKGIENNQASVLGKSEVESMPSNDPSAQASSELKGSFSSDGSIDLTTGLALKTTTKGHLEGVNVRKDNGNEMKMPMIIDSESETVVIK